MTTIQIDFINILHTLYFTLRHVRVLNNVVLATIIEMVEILDGRVGVAFS